MLRRRKSDAAFQRVNLASALQSGAACEVDIVLAADGHALCLHDLTLDRETTGHGRVADATRATIERCRQRGSDGAVLGSAPLFLDEVAAAVAAHGSVAPASVQLDVKLPAQALTPRSLDRIASMLRDQADSFIASAYEWETVQRLVVAAPGLHAGFDPLAFYPRSFQLDADGFRSIAARMLATAPNASIYYLEAKLILAALAHGVDLVRVVTGAGAQVDAWTIDADHPHLSDVLLRLIDLGCHQITSNDPERLYPIIDGLSTRS
ncbi:MAG: glycerophosphodiester phosphodiesterase family protein [Planctomycetota bacterium]